MIKHRPLKVLLYAYSTSTLSLGILNPIYGFFVKDLGGGIVETTSSIALFSIVTGLVTVLCYKAAANTTFRRGFLVDGWLLWLVSLIMYCFINNLYMIYVSQLLGGLGSGLSGSALDAEYARCADKEDLSAGGTYQGTLKITSGVATLMAGLLVNCCGIQLLMMAMASIATLSFLLIFYYSYIKKYVPCKR